MASKKPTAVKNKGGRPATGHVALPAVRLPAKLYIRLKQRLAIMRHNHPMGVIPSISFYIREALTNALDDDDRSDKRAKQKAERRAKRAQRKTPRSR